MRQVYLKYWGKYSQAKSRILFLKRNKIYLNRKGDGPYSLESHYSVSLFFRLRLFSEFQQVAKSKSI
jgi:hypothetical protein